MSVGPDIQLLRQNRALDFRNGNVEKGDDEWVRPALRCVCTWMRALAGAFA